MIERFTLVRRRIEQELANIKVVVDRVEKGILQNIISSRACNRGFCVFRWEDPFVFQFAPAKVEEQAHRRSGGFQVVDDLGDLVVGELVPQSFYLYDYLIFYVKVEIKQSDLFALKYDRNRTLALGSNPLFG
jgi:hypothetical protein